MAKCKRTAGTLKVYRPNIRLEVSSNDSDQADVYLGNRVNVHNPVDTGDAFDLSIVVSEYMRLGGVAVGIYLDDPLFQNSSSGLS